jgi:hypothetical protein
MNVAQWSALTGYVSAFLLLGITIVRQRRFDRVDIGPLAITYFSGSNLPAAVFLCYYVFDPDPAAVLAQTRLAGYEKYLSFAGMALLIVSLVGIWTLLRAAYQRDAGPEAAAVPQTAISSSSSPL